MDNQDVNLRLIGTLYNAVMFKDYKRFREIIATKKIYVSDINGAPLINWTVMNNDPEMTELLLRCKADPNLKNYEQSAPIHHAVKKGKVQIVKILIGGRDNLIRDPDNIKTNLNIRDDSDKTPLHHAVESNNKEITKLLIQGGADPTLKDKSGATPLSLAVFAENVEMIEILLDSGVNTNLQVMSYCPSSPIFDDAKETTQKSTREKDDISNLYSNYDGDDELHCSGEEEVYDSDSE